MLGDTTIPIEVRTDWVWSEIAKRHPEIKRENFHPSIANDPWMLHGMLVDDCCRFLANSDSLVMDIGANRGLFAAFCALKGASVVAYEPNPEAFEILCDTIARNKLENHISAINAAVWTSTGTCEFWWWKQHDVIGTTYSPRGQNMASKTPGEKTIVPAISFDDAIGDYEWDCVKVDIEGGEFDLFRNAAIESLRRIKVLTLEVHTDAADKSPQDTLVARLEGCVVLDGIRDGNPDYEPNSRWISIYATRK